MPLATALLFALPLLTSPSSSREAAQPSVWSDEAPAFATGAESLFELHEERGPELAPVSAEERTKKESWLLEKVTRPDVHVTDTELARAPRPDGASKRSARSAAAETPSLVGARAQPVTTLFNLKTREVLAIGPGPSAEGEFHRFLRDHYTNQATQMDTRLIDVLAKVARKFTAARIEVVSGYRSPKYNLMLRKKGHEVARQSQHTEGNAVDFRIRGVPTKVLLKFVKSLRRGGVGYYPESQFVHSDTGKIRFWKGS